MAVVAVMLRWIDLVGARAYAPVVLCAIVGASVWMFVWNVRRATVGRRGIALREWARNNGLEVDPPTAAVPEVLGRLLPGARWERVIGGDGVRTLARGVDAGGTWHLLVWRVEGERQTVAGLRPARGEGRSVVDVAGAPAYPSLPGVERFVTYGTTLHAAKGLADSPVRGLLPADLGLVVIGPWVVIDFSGRPFDTLEFSRVLALGGQVSSGVPMV